MNRLLAGYPARADKDFSLSALAAFNGTLRVARATRPADSLRRLPALDAHHRRVAGGLRAAQHMGRDDISSVA